MAALKVFPEIAETVGDDEAAEMYRELYPKAKNSFEEKLWDEEKGHYVMCTESLDTRSKEEIAEEDQRYYKPDENPDKNQCRDDQLTGTWYSIFLNQGPVNDPARVEQALDTMKNLLEMDLEGGGRFITRSEHRDRNWPGYNVAHFGALAISVGEVDLGLSSVKGVHDLIYEKWGMIWDQPIGLGKENRPRGDRYMNSGSIWHVLWALQGFHIDIPRGIMGFRPNIPEDWQGSFVSPIITGSFWGEARYRESKSDGFEAELEISLDEDFPVRVLLLKSAGYESVKEIEIEGAETLDFRAEIKDGELVLSFGDPLYIRSGCPVTFRYCLD